MHLKIKRFQIIINKIKHIVTHFKRSPKSNEKLISYQRNAGTVPLKLVKVVENKSGIQLFLHATTIYGVFFSTSKCAFYLKKNAILCLFLKNVSASKRMVCFILNNSHMPMLKGVDFMP